MKKTKKQPTTNKVVEKEKMSTRLYDSREKGKKILENLFKISYLALAIIVFCVEFGGVREVKERLVYPEQEYVMLEQELEKSIVQNEGFYPEIISNSDITYHMSYNETSNSDGIYTIKLTNDVNNVEITGKIDKNFNKQTLVIEREYETEVEYKIFEILNVILITFLLPALLLLILYMVYLFANFIVLLITIPYDIWKKHKQNLGKKSKK